MLWTLRDTISTRSHKPFTRHHSEAPALPYYIRAFSSIPMFESCKQEIYVNLGIHSNLHVHPIIVTYLL